MFETTHLTRRNVLGAGLSAAGLLVTPSVVRAQAARLPVSIICAGGNVTLTLQEVMKRQGYMDEFGLDAKYVNVADIPCSRHNPEVTWIDDPEIVGDGASKSPPVAGYFFAQKSERRIGELRAGRVAFVVRDILVHDAPQSLYRV